MGEFRRHIEEAITVNLKRMPSYALKTFGYSLPISAGLILFEVCIWPLAVYFDFTSKRWYRSDRRIMVDDFISMNKIESWDKVWPQDQRPKAFQRRIGLYAMRRNLIDLLNKGQWQEADHMMTRYRENLDVSAANQYILYKHFLESVHRSLRLTRLWDRKEGLGTQLRLYRKFFVIIQTVGLELCVFLDVLAYPLYKRGIGIIKNDIPHIPVPDEI